eukprot:6016775-Prymnesium_polylepis.1
MNQSACALARQFSGLQRPCHKTRSGQAGKELLRCACAYVAHNVCELAAQGAAGLSTCFWHLGRRRARQ